MSITPATATRRRCAEIGVTAPAAFAGAAGIALLAITGVAACAVPAQQEAEPVRVMSFNVRFGLANDGEDAWPHRADLVVRIIRDFDPAVLGVQEALRFQLDEIESALPHLGEVGVGRDDGDDEGEYAAILFDRRRLHVLEQGTFWLSDTPDAPGSATWGNEITRLATWARFRDRTTDATFYVFNTHWDHESQPSRERSATLLLERIRARTAGGDPVILTGDFNAGEDNPAFQALLAPPGGPAAGRPPVDAGRVARLFDTFRAVHPGAREVGTFNGFRGERDGPKIDAILASPAWRTLDAAIDRSHQDGRYPSDHFPVTATLVLPREQREPEG
jgi:endonuclease/exonuclease/phosphatase family metal-dependent hydrolase